MITNNLMVRYENVSFFVAGMEKHSKNRASVNSKKQCPDGMFCSKPDDDILCFGFGQIVSGILYGNYYIFIIVSVAIFFLLNNCCKMTTFRRTES